MLVDSTVKDFLAKVAGSDPVPGGGSIAALNGAIAAALAAMVAGLTVGKKGYEENEEQMQRIQTLTIRQKEEFLIDVDRDSEAYNKVFDCFRMPNRQRTRRVPVALPSRKQHGLPLSCLCRWHAMLMS